MSPRATTRRVRASGRSVAEVLAPQDERVFHRIGVVGATHAGRGKTQTLVELTRRVVRSPYLERRAPRAEPNALVEHEGEQRRPDALPSVSRRHREVVDVQLVEHSPEGAEADDAARFVTSQVAERNP